MVIKKQQVEMVAPKVPQGVSGLVVSTLGAFVFGLGFHVASLLFLIS